MDTLRLHLIEAGQFISDTDYLSLFMGTLPEEYDIMSTTINYDTDTVEDVVNKLHQIEIWKEVQPGFSYGAAFAALRQGNRGGRASHRGLRGQGYGRGNGGTACSANPNTRCYECNELGHWARNCPRHRSLNSCGFSHNQTGNQPKSTNGAAGPLVLARGLFSMMHAVGTHDPDGCTLKYYLDSGASGHHIPDIKNLHSL
jgi:hypothetical protein